MKKILLPLLLLVCQWAAGASHDCGIVGFAGCDDLGLQGVTGGMDGQIVHVSTHDDLVKYCKAAEAYTIIIDKSITGHWVKGTGGAPSILDEISVTSNKTIIAAGPEVVLDSICFDIKNQRNIIFRNITLKHGKPDGIAFRTTHHVWLDHCDLSSCEDGLMDFTIGSSYCTVSWSAFHDHDKVSLSCSGTMHYEDVGKNRVSYHHNHYYNGTQRNPRIGYGLGHLWNNYWQHNEYQGSWGYCVGYFNWARVLVENSVFTDVKQPFQNMYGVYDYDSSWAQLESRGNIFGSGVSGDTKGTGESFDVSLYYDYDFALQTAESVNAEMLRNVGPQEWVPTDIYGFPNNGAINVSNLNALKWSPIEGAQKYELYLGTSEDAVRLVQDGKERTYALPELQPSTTYYWRVRALLADNTYSETSLWRFTTGAEKASKPEPMDGAEDYAAYAAYPHEGVTMEGCGGYATEAGKLSWARAANAKSYEVYLAEKDREPQLACTTADCFFQPSEPLLLGKDYMWRVDVVKPDGSVITGDTWTFASKQKLIGEGKTECEDMLMYGQTFLELENGKVNWMYKASNDWVTAGEAGTGTLAGTYNGRSGVCDIDFCYFDEKQGQGVYQLRMNNEKVGSFTANKNTNKLATQSFKDITLKKGDQLACDFLMTDKMKCRFDYINITVTSEITGVDSPTLTARQTTDGNSYNLAGQMVDDSYKGIVIRGGKRMIKMTM